VIVRRHASVLFVCTGNICRSPTVEGVFRALVAREGLSREIVTDSAGTHDYQVGQPPDPRAVRAAQRRGYELPARRARQFDRRKDFERFDWILAMDRDNLEALQPLRPGKYAGHLGLFLDFAPEVGVREIPDPYHGTASDFDHVLDLAERGVEPLLAAIRANLPQAR
jgi:low molecular weight protein-tyrosine phosphatase